jgi:hypothetical protein
MKVSSVEGLECIYCGSPATERDHVIPHAIVNVALSSGEYPKRSFEDTEVVPACRDCNASLHSKMLLTIADRAAWQAKRLERKLDRTEKRAWTTQELEELGPTLRVYVIEKQRHKANLEQRLSRCEGVARLVDLTPVEYWLSDKAAG